MDIKDLKSMIYDETNLNTTFRIYPININAKLKKTKNIVTNEAKYLDESKFSKYFTYVENKIYDESIFRNTVNIVTSEETKTFMFENNYIGNYNDLLISTIKMTVIENNCFPILSKYNKSCSNNVKIYEFKHRKKCEHFFLNDTNSCSFFQFKNDKPKNSYELIKKIIIVIEKLKN